MSGLAELNLGILTSCGPMLCSCGRLATETIATEKFGTIGYCGIAGQQPLDPHECNLVPTVHDHAYCAQLRGEVIVDRCAIASIDLERVSDEVDRIVAQIRATGETRGLSEAELDECRQAAFWQMLREIVRVYRERDGR